MGSLGVIELGGSVRSLDEIELRAGWGVLV